MEIIGITVKHKTLGVGKIIDQDEGLITVDFSSKTSKFAYPSAFQNFIQAEDSSVQSAILHQLEEEGRKLQESKDSVVQKRNANHSKYIIEGKKDYKPQNHNRGKPRLFYVFQGSTFDRESRGGYIWAPITNKEGHRYHHWDNLLEVRFGDIILHGCDGQVVAVSTARGACYEYEQPVELRKENSWENYGRRVDCEYTVFKTPIKTANYKEDIIRLSASKYSPFNKYGGGNMGYLYKIEPKLAQLFLREIIKHNPYIDAVDYIKEFLK